LQQFFSGITDSKTGIKKKSDYTPVFTPFLKYISFNIR
jgi:hypothetical protein